jgi:hypothetical protein
VKTFKYLGSLVAKILFRRKKALLSSQIPSKNVTIKIYKTIILPVVLYGCEAWSLTLTEECRLRVFENRILSRISGLKRDENGQCKRLHNKELHSLYRSPIRFRVIKSRRLRWAGHVARMEIGRSIFKILIGRLHLQKRDF